MEAEVDSAHTIASIEIFDFNNVKDATEEKRLNTESPPRLIASDREILWEILLPQVPCIVTAARRNGAAERRDAWTQDLTRER